MAQVRENRKQDQRPAELEGDTGKMQIMTEGGRQKQARRTEEVGKQGREEKMTVNRARWAQV